MINRKQLPAHKFLDVELVSRIGDTDASLPHRHEYYEIFWTVEGAGRHLIDFTDYPLEPDILYFMTPGQVHETPVLPEKMYAVSFNEEVISSGFRDLLLLENNFFSRQAGHPTIQPDEDGRRDLSQILDLMIRELAKENRDWNLLQSLLTAFLQYLIRYQSADSSEGRNIDDRVTRLQTLIDENFSRHKNTDFYSDLLFLTNKRVNELTKKHLGKTVTQMIHERVILEARRELAFTNKTVKAISIELGYHETTYFNRFFRRMTGESPVSFRKRWFK